MATHPAMEEAADSVAVVAVAVTLAEDAADSSAAVAVAATLEEDAEAIGETPAHAKRCSLIDASPAR